MAVAAVLALAAPAAAFLAPSILFARGRSFLVSCERHAEDDEWSITTLEQLRDLIPAGPVGSGLADAHKVINKTWPESRWTQVRFFKHRRQGQRDGSYVV